MKQRLEVYIYLLLVIGGINWGSIGAFNINVVQLVFGFAPVFVQLIYVIFGLSGFYVLYQMTKKQEQEQKKKRKK